MTTRVITKPPTGSGGSNQKKHLHHAEGMHVPDDEPRSVRGAPRGGRPEYAEGMHRGFARGRVGSVKSGKNTKRGRAGGGIEPAYSKWLHDLDRELARLTDGDLSNIHFREPWLRQRFENGTSAVTAARIGRLQFYSPSSLGAARGRTKRGRAIGSVSKPFIIKKSGSGWKLFLRLDVMRQYAARESMVDKFVKNVADYNKKMYGDAYPTGNEMVAINAVPTRGDGYMVVIVRPNEARAMSTKYRASSIAHHFGRYNFGLSDFVDSYVTYESRS